MESQGAMAIDEIMYGLTKELGRYQYVISSIDRIWHLIFPDSKGKWHHLQVIRYRDTSYLHHVDGESCSLEVTPKKGVKVMESFGLSHHHDGRHALATVWEPLVSSARAWLKTVRRDWVKAGRRVLEAYPLNRRLGVAPNALIRTSLADVYRIDRALGKRACRKFIRLVEEGHFFREAHAITASMTAKDYFDYCKIAYIAGKRKGEQIDERLTGREMYKRYADGRHEGLLDIDEVSAEEFAAWIDGKHPKRHPGGHPWEIKRGGNTTHIDLSVYRPLYGTSSGYKVELRGESIGRLAETIRMFLAIHDASLPITISHPEGIRKRILAEDNVGIVPCYESLHRANQHFGEDQHVFDTLHYDDLGRYKRRITPFITWEPLPILKPKEL
jgi:hypothetical protein